MATYGFYAIRAKPELVECPDIDDDFAELLLAERPIFCNPERGRSIWRTKDHETFVKLLFLADKKADYEHPFFANAAISVEFFDQWWMIERYDGVDNVETIIDNLDPELIEQFKDSGIPHVDDRFRELCRREPRTDFWVDYSRYRVWWKGDVIGWILDPQWELPYLRGRWSPTTNPMGKRFAEEHSPDTKYDVVIDGDTHLHGQLVDHGGSISFEIQFASDKVRVAKRDDA